MDWFPICMGAFGVAFIVFIFLKSYLDDKKERRVLTEIFQQHGIRTNAKVVGFQEHHTYGRGIPGDSRSTSASGIRARRSATRPAP